MRESVDIAVVGGGIAGLSVAALLARHASVVVLEAEEQPGYHATGRSAAVFAQNYGSPLTRALTAWSARVYEAMVPAVLSPRGLLRFAPETDRDRMAALFRKMSRDVPLAWLEADEIAARLPLLRPGRAGCGFENAAAMDMDVSAILQAHVRTLIAHSGRLVTGFRLVMARRADARWTLTSEKGATVAADILVNAAGAWADEIAVIAGAVPLGLTPLRRSAVIFDPPAGRDIAGLPMAIDLDETLYVKPEAGRLMASPCDETPAPLADSRPEEIDIAICLDRVERLFDIPSPRPLAAWSGLRTFAPDREPLCGWDTACPGLFWLAGQGGYGVQTAPALARLAADRILHDDAQSRTEMPGVDPRAIAPDRFAEHHSRPKTGELR